MIKKTFTIDNKLGLHARAAAKFVATASHYTSHIDVHKGNQIANGKSIMGMMTLAATYGSKIELQIDGEDEQPMLNALMKLIQNRFDESE